MILEQQEAEHIELRPNLLKACADERQAFCSGVAPGSARVFRWVLGFGWRGLKHVLELCELWAGLAL
jgi:hypothetical protein